MNWMISVSTLPSILNIPTNPRLRNPSSVNWQLSWLLLTKTSKCNSQHNTKLSWLIQKPLFIIIITENLHLSHKNSAQKQSRNKNMQQINYNCPTTQKYILKDTLIIASNFTKFHQTNSINSAQKSRNKFSSKS